MMLDRMPGKEGVVDPCDISGYNKNKQSGGGGGGGSTLIEKSISANGVYNASEDNADGYSKVTVNVAAPTPETFEVEIISDDGVTGTCNKTYAEIISAINQGKQLAGTVTMDIPDIPTFNSNIAYAYITNVVYGYPGGTETFNNAIYFTTNVIPPIAGITNRSIILYGIILPETWGGAEILMFMAQISN